MYSYENYSKVKEKIEKRRTDARAEADYRSITLREESPEIAQIDATLSKTGLLLFKTACSGGDVSEIRERNAALTKKRKEILLSLGYPEDYTDVKYFCEKCSDTGFAENGKMCSCFREELIKATIASSGIGRLIEKQSFENFSLDAITDEAERKKTEKALKHCIAFAKNFAKDRGNLLLIGKTGTGKTHISTAIAREVISAGFDVVYDSAQNIFTNIENEKFRSGYDLQESQSSKYYECDLLIMDDLGTEFKTSFTLSCLYNIVNTRQNRGLSTIISTNLSPAELASSYEDRIYSRIVGAEYTVLRFSGKDMRIS